MSINGYYAMREAVTLVRTNVTPASLILNAITHPIEMIRFMQQVDRDLSQTSLVEVARLIYDNDGILGFTKGMLPALIGVYLEDFLTTNSAQLLLRVFGNAIAPYLSEVCPLIAHVLAYPLHAIRSRIMSQRLRTPVMYYSDFKFATQTHGILCWWQGVTASLLHRFARMRMSVLVSSLSIMQNMFNKAIRTTQHAWIGVFPIYGFIVELVAYPFSTIARILDMQKAVRNKEYILVHPVVEANGILDCVMKLVNSRGVSALWNGFGMECVKYVGAHALLVAYVYGRQLLGGVPQYQRA